MYDWEVIRNGSSVKMVGCSKHKDILKILIYTYYGLDFVFGDLAGSTEMPF
jgi:hypothetical protein